MAQAMQPHLDCPDLGDPAVIEPTGAAACGGAGGGAAERAASLPARQREGIIDEHIAAPQPRRITKEES